MNHQRGRHNLKKGKHHHPISPHHHGRTEIETNQSFPSPEYLLQELELY
jgi:hypothetical protein